MRRVLEPEVMDGVEQAAVYANANFEFANNLFIREFDELCQVQKHHINTIIDVGCGPGDILLKLAEKNTFARCDGIDASVAMLDVAEKRKASMKNTSTQVNFYCSLLPQIPTKFPDCYHAVISNSFLHHLPDPNVLWNCAQQFTGKDGVILVMDLIRPGSKSEAEQMVGKHAGNEPELLQKDFYNSLMAAFSMTEIKKQLNEQSLNHLEVKQVSDRHLMISGKIRT